MNSTKTKQIYQLIDPRDGRPFYVGQAISPEKRLEQHIKDARDNQTRKRIKSIIEDNLLPTVEILDTVPERDAHERERQLIRETDCLTNISCNSVVVARSKKEQRIKFAMSLLPKAHQGLKKHYQEEKEARVVPEIPVKAWGNIAPHLDNADEVSIYDLAEWAGVCRSWASRSQWIQSIAREFPETWQVARISRRLVLRRKGGRP